MLQCSIDFSSDGFVEEYGGVKSIDKEEAVQEQEREREREKNTDQWTHAEAKGYIIKKGLQKKPESAKSGTEEDVEAYIEERVDEPSSKEFPISSIPQGPAPAKIAAHIYMLTEVKYPLPPRVFKAMLEKKLLGDRKDELAIVLQKAKHIQDFGPTAALFDIKDNKALRPDHFTSKLFKASWGVVGGDVSMAVKEFFASASILRRALDELSLSSGLYPSIAKSIVYFRNVPNNVRCNILMMMPFEEGELPARSCNIWFDYWQDRGPLSRFIDQRTIVLVGLILNTKISDLICNSSWTWPNEWFNDFVEVLNIPVPILNNEIDDRTVWVNRKGNEKSFSMSEGKVVSGIVNKAASNGIWSIIQRLVFGATVYFIWQKRNFRLFNNLKLVEYGKYWYVGLQQNLFKGCLDFKVYFQGRLGKEACYCSIEDWGSFLFRLYHLFPEGFKYGNLLIFYELPCALFFAFLDAFQFWGKLGSFLVFACRVGTLVLAWLGYGDVSVGVWLVSGFPDD
ncbi:hypothetical protein Tco_0528280 [Tanacetum coccineum]